LPEEFQRRPPDALRGAFLSEEILRRVVEGRRDDVLLATKARMPMGDGPNDAGLSRQHLSGWDEPPVRDQDKLYDIVHVVVEVAKDRGVSPARVALAWLLDRPAVTSVVIGARTEEQLADNLGAADLSHSEEERARLEEVSRPPLLYPYWHQAKTAADRLSPADRSLLGPYLAR
jgi:aryl-alcohol dehydrogenase-like predicted oxidoreductase